MREYVVFVRKIVTQLISAQEMVIILMTPGVVSLPPLHPAPTRRSDVLGILQFSQAVM